MLRPTQINSYNDFLKVSIERYWKISGSSKRTLIALFIATQQTWYVAWEKTRKSGFARPMLTSTASLTTLIFVLRFLASGPLGILLTSASIASLLIVYKTDKTTIRVRTHIIREVVETYHLEFEELLKERKSRLMRTAQWELIMENLISRFLGALHDAPYAKRNSSIDQFAEHVYQSMIRSN